MEVIAEIGKNFITTEQVQPESELLSNARQLINLAADAGCQTAKFQVHADDEIHPEFHGVAAHFNQDRKSWVKRCTFSSEFWGQIKDSCVEAGVDFLATPMSRGAAEVLDEVGVERWKIGSADVTDFVLLDYIRDSNKPVILSSGMSTLQELERAYLYLKEKAEDITILHCVSEYPCPLENLNLSTISFLRQHFPGVNVGFSDHSVGIEGSLMAASLGVEIIEKHFTKSRAAWGPDHQVSLEPHGLSELMRRLRDKDFPAFQSEVLGVHTKFVSEGEMKFRKVFRKKLFAARDVKAGEIWESSMFCALRHTEGESTSRYQELLGIFATKDYGQYEAIV